MEQALAAMRSQPALATAQRNGAVRLAHLLAAQGEPAALALLDEGLQVLLGAMRTHLSSTEVQRWCCEVLTGLAGSAGLPGAEAVVAQDGLKDVVSAMKSHLHSCEVQRWGAAALNSVAGSGGHKIATAIADVGAVEVLVLAMNAHPDSAAVQENGASALSYAALDGGSDVVSKVVSLGGLEAVVTAMRTHPKNSELHRWGLTALWASIEEGGTEALDSVAAAGGLEAAVHALHNFPQQHEVRHWGFAFLRAVASNCNEDTFHALGTSGGLDAVAAAMMCVPENVDVQERGLATLAMLASHCSGITADARASILEVVVSALQLHSGSVEVQRWGIGALASLVDGRKKSEALDRSIVGTTVTAMRANLEDVKLQVAGQDVLWGMTHNEVDEVVRLVLEEGAPQAVIEATRAHPESKELAQACSAWRRVMETMAFEHGLDEATALAYPTQDAPQEAPADGIEEAEETTTATDSAEERELSDDEDVPTKPLNDIAFDDSLEVDL